jgi:putative transposase
VLADEGIYIASESSFHRVLREHGQMNRKRWPAALL